MSLVFGNSQPGGGVTNEIAITRMRLYLVLVKSTIHLVTDRVIEQPIDICISVYRNAPLTAKQTARETARASPEIIVQAG